jgi:ABC-2 type transport system permease protein
MLRGLLKLTWLEIKIFAREPLGLVGTLAVPIVLFLVAGRAFGSIPRKASGEMGKLVGVDLPVLATVLMSLSAVLSLVTIVSIYREGGILKRLRATPLRPATILGAQVLVKLLFTALTLLLLVIAGKRYYPVPVDVRPLSFTLALLIATVALLSLGFIIASMVPTARFAQPIAGAILYPMLGLSGLFVPVAVLPEAVRPIARVLPLTYAVSLLRGIWSGDGWLAHGGDVAVLAATTVACVAISSRVFRWE